MCMYMWMFSHQLSRPLAHSIFCKRFLLTLSSTGYSLGEEISDHIISIYIKSQHPFPFCTARQFCQNYNHNRGTNGSMKTFFKQEPPETPLPTRESTSQSSGYSQFTCQTRIPDTYYPYRFSLNHKIGAFFERFPSYSYHILP